MEVFVRYKTVELLLKSRRLALLYHVVYHGEILPNLRKPWLFPRYVIGSSTGCRSENRKSVVFSAHSTFPCMMKSLSDLSPSSPGFFCLLQREGLVTTTSRR